MITSGHASIQFGFSRQKQSTNREQMSWDLKRHPIPIFLQTSWHIYVLSHSDDNNDLLKKWKKLHKLHVEINSIGHPEHESLQLKWMERSC